MKKTFFALIVLVCMCVSSVSVTAHPFDMMNVLQSGHKPSVEEMMQLVMTPEYVCVCVCVCVRMHTFVVCYLLFLLL